jgi:hypothetical protein
VRKYGKPGYENAIIAEKRDGNCHPLNYFSMKYSLFDHHFLNPLFMWCLHNNQV